MNTDVVILCGMPSEKAILAAAYPNNLVLSGNDKLNLAMLVPSGTKRIVSMGLCGGLAPPLRVADIVLASAVTAGGGITYPCDPLWNAAIAKIGKESAPAAWASRLAVVPWFSSSTVDLADTRDQRIIIFSITKAMAIDDETYYAALFCQQRGILLNVARSISDDSTETLPLAARGAIMTAMGSVNYEYLITELLTEPVAQTLDLPKIAMDYNASLATLRGLAQGVVL